MAKRIGKYKITKRDDALTAVPLGNDDVHLKSEGTAPTVEATTAGNGTCTMDATSTDTCMSMTFANTWADGDTAVVTFANAYATAPKVILSAFPINGSGAHLIEIDTLAVTTTGFTLTASGTAAGVLTCLVIETV